MRMRTVAGLIITAAVLAGCHDGYSRASYNVGYSSDSYAYCPPRHTTYSYRVVSPAYCPPVQVHHHRRHHHGHYGHGHW